MLPRSLRLTLLRDCRARVRLPTYRSTTVHGDILVVTLIVITNYTVRITYILFWGLAVRMYRSQRVHSHTLCGLHYYSLSLCHCDCVCLSVYACTCTTLAKTLQSFTYSSLTIYSWCTALVHLSTTKNFVKIRY